MENLQRAFLVFLLLITVVPYPRVARHRGNRYTLIVAFYESGSAPSCRKEIVSRSGNKVGRMLTSVKRYML